MYILKQQQALSVLPMLLSASILFSCETLANGDITITGKSDEQQNAIADVLEQTKELPFFANVMKIVDMNYNELVGVEEDYEVPSDHAEIEWVIENSSYEYKTNRSEGTCDYIFNLNVLEHTLETNPAPTKALALQLTKLHEQGHGYILFNAGT